ncbi:twin-arginine translocation pathway signal protein [Marichromatium purpuratum 984]|uniref:Thiol:disulfide interchange protein n=1 Tax=Marichromatium purpuratum 984 TaxID=765910 RepID=W0DXF6_MARPU|nr:thiol:disulfide interchange protein DsbA/DsbL [Marichromatium purpuratum]AHF03275.1 twin-arginine translocation pathway signal protein [Marichromatium purpuratum 984]
MPLSRRHFNFILMGTLGALTEPLPARSAPLAEGRDWRPIDPPQPGDVPGKIEVLEFFSYGCPHCSDLNPIVKEWAGRQPEDVAFRRVPVTFGRTAWANLARLYYALEASDALEQHDQAVFDALHRERRRLYSPNAILDWVEARGLDRAAFAALFDSFDIQAKIARSDRLVQRYRIQAVPRVTVAGRYAVLGKEVSSYRELLGIAETLIEQTREQGLAG